MKHTAGGSLLQHSCRSRLDRACGTRKLKSSTLFGLDASLTLAQSDITQVRDGLMSSVTTFSRAPQSEDMWNSSVQRSSSRDVQSSNSWFLCSLSTVQRHAWLVGENDNFESSDHMLQMFFIFLRNTHIPLFSPLTSIFWCLCLVVAFRH